MATTDVSSPTPVQAPSPADDANRRSDAHVRRHHWWSDERLIAAVTWLVGVLVSFVVVQVGQANPVSVRGSIMPVGLGIFGFAVLLFFVYRFWGRAGNALLGVVVGAYAGWVALVGKAALSGTTMSFGGNLGDAHRITAQAEKYSTTWFSTDVFLPGTPSDYPPLYTWLTGRFSQLLGEPAWQLMQNTQVLWLSGAVVVAFVLWRHLVPTPTAAVIAMVAFVGNNNPIKPYEVIALVVMVPWILATFGNPPSASTRGRMHWLPAGVVGGLLCLTYQGYMVFMAVGVLAIVWWAWRGAEDRRAYVLHLVKVAATALVVASWYLLPFLWATLTRPGGNFGSDTFQSSIISTDPLPLHFFDTNPVGLIQLFGIVGLAVYLNRAWWARPLAALLGGTYLFFFLGALRFVLTRHTMFYQYAIGPIVMVALTAGILTVAEALRGFAEHRFAPQARRVVVVLTVATLAWTLLVVWRAWMPTTVGNSDSPRVAATAGRPADLAHIESAADLSRSRYAPITDDLTAVPASLIEAAVVARYGPDARPMVLSADERLYAFVTWYCYVGQSPTASPALDRWAEHVAEVSKLTQIADPAQFAQGADTTAFGKIDVFVLRREKDPASGVYSGELSWHTGTGFRPEQFSPSAYDRVDLPNDFVVFIRHR